MPHLAKSNERQTVYQNQFRKTVICRFFLSNACKKGAKCTFAHSVEELQEVPDLRKTALCKLWKRGLCSLSGDRCHFAHSKRELRMSPAFAELALSKHSLPASGSESTQSPLSSAHSQCSGSPPATPRRVPEQAPNPGGAPLLARAPDAGMPSPTCADPAPEAQRDGEMPRKAESLTALAELTAKIAKGQPTIPAPPQPWVPSSRPQPAEATPQLVGKSKEGEPAFVQVPKAQISAKSTLPSEDLFGACSRILAGPPQHMMREPAFVDVSAAPTLRPEATPVLEGKSKLALSQWLAMDAENATGVSTPAIVSRPGQGSGLANQRAAELRAFATAAEQKAAAYAQEAALLRSVADTAERELASLGASWGRKSTEWGL